MVLTGGHMAFFQDLLYFASSTGLASPEIFKT